MPSPNPQEMKEKHFKEGVLISFFFFFFNFTRYHFEFRKHQLPFSCKGKCPHLCNFFSEFAF